MTPPRTCRARKGRGCAAGRIELGGFSPIPGSWPIPRARQPGSRFARLVHGRPRFSSGRQHTARPAAARSSGGSQVDQLGRTRSRFFQAVQRETAARARHLVPVTSREFSSRSRVDQLGRTEAGPDQPNLDSSLLLPNIEMNFSIMRSRIKPFSRNNFMLRRWGVWDRTYPGSIPPI